MPRARSRLLTPAGLVALAGLLTTATALVTACTPTVNLVLERVLPSHKPIESLPEAASDVVPVESFAPVTAPHNGPPPVEHLPPPTDVPY